MSFAAGKAEILGCKIDIVDNVQALQIIEEIIDAKTPAQVITLNAEIAYQTRHDKDLKEIINSARLVTPDGIGIVWGGRQLGYDFPERVTGIDLLSGICTMALRKQWPIFLLGAAPGVAEGAAYELIRRFPGLDVCGTQHGYFKPEEEAQVVGKIKQARPDILFVALGAPRQEYWINRYKEEMNVPLCMGVGGSFDVIAGIKKRAPAIFIKLNLEWFYRLVGEPSRWKRQLALPRYVLAILKASVSRRH